MRTVTWTLATCLIMLTLGACTSDSERAAAVTAEVAEAPSTSASLLPLAEPMLMTADAVGPARLGMTEAELVAALGTSLTLSDDTVIFEEGFGVRPVALDGEDVFFVHFDFETGRVLSIVTTSERVETEQGLAPGMSITEAASLLGEPSFTFYRFEGGRESVEFATAITPFVRPRGADGLGTAGIYNFSVATDDPIGPFRSTDYAPDAVIFSLTIEASAG